MAVSCWGRAMLALVKRGEKADTPRKSILLQCQGREGLAVSLHVCRRLGSYDMGFSG